MFLYDGSKTSVEFTPLYSCWAIAMIIQMLAFSWFTGRTRVRCEVVHSAEDRMWFENREVKICPSGGGHPEVDHIRSGHYNDLSVILPYLLMVPIWLNTNPSRLTAQCLLYLFPIAKILDTLFYMEVVSAPKICRLVALTISYTVLVYMCVSNVIHYWHLSN